MRRKKPKGLKSKSETILLIVENTEVLFFNQYFKKYLKEEESLFIDCISSGRAGNCEITNGNRMRKKIESALLDDAYRAVFLMIDLKSKCRYLEKTHTCLLQLKEEYMPRYKISKVLQERFYFFVVCNEIESWFLTIDEHIHNTNNPNNNHKKIIKKLFEVEREIEIVDKLLKGLKNGEYRLNVAKNTSLQHFITKLKEFS